MVHELQSLYEAQLFAGGVGTGAGVAGHSDASQSHDTQLPTLGPLAVPWEQVFVLAHQPQLPDAAVAVQV